MRVILAGGGTGGHVIPALAIAQQLKKEFSADVLFIGTPRGMENRLVPAAGFDLKLVQVGALNRVSLATRLRTLSDLPRAVWSASQMLADFRADVVIGVGGYASGPAMAAAIDQDLKAVLPHATIRRESSTKRKRILGSTAAKAWLLSWSDFRLPRKPHSPRITLRFERCNRLGRSRACRQLPRFSTWADSALSGRMRCTLRSAKRDSPYSNGRDQWQ